MDLEARIRVEHVRLPLGRSQYVGRIRCGRRLGRGSTTYRQTLDSHAIEPDVQLLRRSHPEDVVVVGFLQTDLDAVLAVDRKVIANRETAARPEREVVADAIVLHHVERNLVRVGNRAGRGTSNGETTHLSGR